MRLIEKSITLSVYDSLNESKDMSNSDKEFYGHTVQDDYDEYGGPVAFDHFYRRALDFGVENEAFETYGSRSESNIIKIVRQAYKEYKKSFKLNESAQYYYKMFNSSGEIDYMEFDTSSEAGEYAQRMNKETGNETAVYDMSNDECISSYDAINESAELTAKVTYHDEDGTREYTAGKLSDGRYFLISHQEQIVISDKNLPSLAKKDMDEYFYDEDGDKEFIEAIENGTTLDKNSDLAKVIINASRKYLEDGCYLLSEAEEVKEDKKVTKVEVLILPTIKFMWAEGNQDNIKTLFGSAEEHDMDFSKFQNAVYVLDREVSERDGGYDKVKYVANIQVKFTYEDGSASEETSTYTGRVDCGDGYKYVTVSKNMKHFIQEEFKDAEVIVREDDTAELKESAETGKITLKDYAMNFHEGDIDMDVTDIEIDMLVAFVYDFNEEPKDNYDRFLNLLGERTKVVKVNEWNLVCDFSSVFKHYEDKLQDFFNMEYSEFDEAWAEAVLNLEPLISGNAGEKTYKELIDILTGKQINESAEIDSDKDSHKLTDMVMELHSYVEAEPGKISRDLKAAIKSNKLEDYLKHKAAMDDEEISNFIKKYFGENMNESASYEGYTDKEIIKNVIDNFKEITGKEVKDVLNYDEAVEGFFKQGEVENTGESIINYLTKKGLSRSHIDELLYKLDDELTSLWNKL